MNGRAAARIESAVDAGASALFAAAAAYALHAWSAAIAASAAGGALAFALCFAGLRKFEPEERRFELADFVSRDGAAAPAEELVLTEADRWVAPEPSAADVDELILDDVLAEIGSDSRVVRLFDPEATPTPGQLQSRISRHLDGRTSPSAPPDASQALYDALAELRRSLN